MLIISNLLIFSVNIEALNTVWLLGGDFLRMMFHSLEQLLTMAKQDNKPWPYLMHYYNVDPLHLPQLSNNRALLSCILNALVKKMNTDWHLLKYLLILIDQDLIAESGVYDYGVTHTLEDTIKWFLININLVLETQKQDLMTRRPGAVASSVEPRLIWVTMLCCPEYSMNKQIYSLARKFNNILESVIVGDKRSHILKIRVPHDTTHFDRIGNLTQIGRYEYWNFLNNEIWDLERSKTDLAPSPASLSDGRPSSSSHPTSEGYTYTRRYKTVLVNRRNRDHCN